MRFSSGVMCTLPYNYSYVCLFLVLIYVPIVRINMIIIIIYRYIQFNVFRVGISSIWWIRPVYVTYIVPIMGQITMGFISNQNQLRNDFKSLNARNATLFTLCFIVFIKYKCATNINVVKFTESSVTCYRHIISI